MRLTKVASVKPREIFSFLVALVLGGALPHALAGQADPLVGIWKTNFEKSTWDPRIPHVKVWTSKIERVEDGYKVTGDGVDGHDQVVHVEIFWRFDGKESPIIGQPATYTWKRIDDHNFETIRREANETITTRSAISRDGKKRINTITGKNSQGQTIRNSIEVMDKR